MSTDEEHTPAQRPLGRVEYNVLLDRLDSIDRRLTGIEQQALRGVNYAIKAHQKANSALWLRSTWAPYVLAGLALLVSVFEACRR